MFGEPVEITAAWIGIIGVVVTILTAFGSGRYFAGRQEVKQDVAIELELRGLLQDQANALDEVRERLADCLERHFLDERRILACEGEIRVLQETVGQKDYEIRALRYDIAQLQARGG